MAIINTSAVNNTIDNKSFAILRTNPKLASNIKLIVDSDSKLYLSTFKANKELAQVQYQKYDISADGVYSKDVASFFRDLPNTEKYQILRTNTDTTLYSDYSIQYEDQYQYGALHNVTKLYKEQYKLFAPIWLEKKMPSKFVVYRVEDVDYKGTYDETTLGQNGRLVELLNKATIIKTFDLSLNSPIGKYLSNHINDKLFPTAPLTVNFKEGASSFYNGIDTVNGGFASKAEQFDKYYTQVDYPEIVSNEIITQGFERNSLIVANLINLEFLFDDYTAEDYKIYRYFGLYVDDIDEGYFKIDAIPGNGIINIDLNSYKTIYDLSGTSLTQLDMLPKPSELLNPALHYVKDKNGDFHNIKNAVDFPVGKLPVSMNGVKSDSFIGFAKTGRVINADRNVASPRGFIKFEVVGTPNHNDKFFIGDKTEIEIAGYNLGDFTFVADNSLAPGRALNNRFSNQGTLQQIAIAISSAIKMGEVMTYQTHVDGNKVIIEDYLDGNQRNLTAFGTYNLNFINNFILMLDADSNNIGLVDQLVPNTTNTVFSDWTIWTMKGGSNTSAGFLVKSSEIQDINVGDEWIKEKDKEIYSKIIEFVQDPFDQTLYRVILEKPIKFSNDMVFETYMPFEVSHGRFSAYDFKDFDFDFYSTRNSQLGDLAYDQLPTGINAFDFYTGLSPVLENEKIDETQVATNLNSEYDRLSENRLKETSIKSRVIPYIAKFALKNSTNARNLPYMLNVNEAFGEDNLSPNIEIDSARNIDLMNMEHFHIHSIPSSVVDGNRKDFNNYVNFGNSDLTINKLKDTSFNYFDAYFNWNGYLDESDLNNPPIWFDNTFKSLWTKFDDGNLEKNSSTVFRGLRYIYQKRKETTLQNPTEFIPTNEVNDYKFGVVLKYTNGANKNSVTVNSIKNDAFKFICILIELEIVQNDIDNLDRYLLYTLKDLESNNAIIDTTIEFQIDFQNSSFGAQNDEAILSASQFSINDGTAKFLTYVTPDEIGNYSWIYFNLGLDTWAVKVVRVINDDSIVVSGWPYAFNPQTGVIGTLRLDPFQFGLIAYNSLFKYYQGGRNQFASILNQLNAYNFANLFNKFGTINYVTVDLNGNILNNQYTLSIESGVDVIKPSIVTAKADADRPKAYQLVSGEIGKVIVDREDGGYITVLRRMNGNYNPLFNNVITFTDLYNSNKVSISNSEYETLVYNRLNGNGLAFESFKNNAEGFGIIKNYFYHKVNDENSKNILKLSQTSDKLPLYPAIGEIAIDKKDLNLFRSKYSPLYFSKALPGGTSENVHGTLSPVEKKTFMVSTIMKVKDSYDITKFDSTKEISLEALDKIRFEQSNVTSIHWYENDSEVIADFYLPSAILNELIEDGIKPRFKKYIDSEFSFGDKESINDDLQIYANNNITPRFILDNIDIYGIQGKDLQTSFVSVTNVTELTKDNFTKLTNYNILSYQNDGLSFRLIYSKMVGYSYNFKIHVKIQA
jgi:hypothetical protein